MSRLVVLSVCCQLAQPVWGGQGEPMPLSFFECLGSMVQDGEDWIDPLSIHEQDLLSGVQSDAGVEPAMTNTIDDSGVSSDVEQDVQFRNEANDEH